MIQVTFPDGTIREYEKGTSALQIAMSISEGLARNVLAARVNGQVSFIFQVLNLPLVHR
jgi:threonyl-tRNA synthetase